MKNRRGEIATLLTLGLVLVGGVAAIATSIFTNNQKNLASGARAGTTYSCCKVYENSSVCNGGKRILNIGNAYQSACSANGAVDCSSVGGPTASGGSKCVGTPPPAAVSVSPAQGQGPSVSPATSTAANQCEKTSGQYCLPLVSTAAGYDNCAPNTFVGMGYSMCNDSKKVCCRGNKPTTGGSFTGSTPVSSSVSPAAASTDVLTPDRLCCKTYGCGQYGASADQKMVKVVGYTGTYKGTDGYTSCATTGYTNVQQCSSIPGAPTSNGATGFVACDPGTNPSAVNPVNNAVTGTGNSGTGLTGPGGVEYCCIVYKQGLYASQYGCDASQYVAKVVGFTGTKDGTDGYTSCATTGYEKYSSIQKVGNCSSMAETQSLAGAGSGSICVGNPDAAPAQLSACEQTSGQYCLPLVSTAAGYDNCAPNTFVGMGSTMCGDSTKVCCRGNKTQTGGSITGKPPTGCIAPTLLGSVMTCPRGAYTLTNGWCCQNSAYPIPSVQTPIQTVPSVAVAQQPAVTPFCQTTKVPKIATGLLKISAYNANGQGTTVDVGSMVDAYIQARVSTEMRGLHTAQEISKVMNGLINKGFLQGGGEVLSNLSKNMPLTYVNFNVNGQNYVVSTGLNEGPANASMVMTTAGTIGNALNVVSNSLVNQYIIDNVCQ